MLQENTEKNIEENIEIATHIPGQKLLDLTPVCLQNTNNINNTLLFMCLDQGHDFRDTSKRTMVKGARGWVNAEFKSSKTDSYLKKFGERILQKLFDKKEEGTDFTLLKSSELFGATEFMKGLLNTTFAGDTGAFALILIEDDDLKRFEPDLTDITKQNIANLINKKLNEIISFQLNKDSMGTYCLQFTTGDGIGENYGTKFSLVKPDGLSLDVTFLPFYKRCYNDGMHKLWSFNTKKHIFIVNLEELKLVKETEQFSLIVSDDSFKSKYFTEIGVVIPQYYFNFSQFYPAKKGANPFMDVYKKFYEDQGKPIPKQVDYSGDADKIFDIFSKALFTNQYLRSMDVDTKEDSSQDTFTFPMPADADSPMYKYIPRGVKYWFACCQDDRAVFPEFVKLLYKHQTPFIHPNYNISNNIDNRIEDTKENIFQQLTKDDNELLNKYILIKNNLNTTETELSGDPFILKQYGAITDTSIGTGSSKSTINYLIDSFNNTNEGTSCDSYSVTSSSASASALSARTDIETISPSSVPNSNEGYSVGGKAGDLQFVREFFKDNTEISNSINDPIRIIENNKYLGAKKAIEEIYEILANIPLSPEKTDITAKLTVKLKEMFTDPKANNKIDELAATVSSAVSDQPSTEEATTTAVINDKQSIEESLSPKESVSTEVADDTESTKEVVSPEEIIFDNIGNINPIFNLSLTPPLKDYVTINSTSTTFPGKFNEYIKEYSNDLQQYYDFIKQTESTSDSNNYFNNCWKSTNFYETNQTNSMKGGVGIKKQLGEDRMSTYPYKFSISSGQLDSSGLGGQIVPVYHPPEIDVYMTIFNDLGQLEGLIVRMVISKQIFENPINAKSNTAVFCHFVYVDFDKAGMSDKKTSDPAQYSYCIKTLLQYTIDNTRYIKDENCINFSELPADINQNDNIDFVLYFPNKSQSDTDKIQSRNWYKYFTTSTGPSVEIGIVAVAEGKSVKELQTKATLKVSNDIVNTAYYIIRNSNNLRKIFGVQDRLSEEDLNINPGIVLFIKLFLIRNKYTGDKSRATDSLFLNQTKYLEGIQVSNDENTLYNAGMFGQNIIWSTSAKSVFNMAPYYTQNKKMPITSGFFVKDLCRGLKNNPLFKVDTGIAKESSGKGQQNEEELLKQELTSELLNEWKLSNPIIKTCTSALVLLEKLAYALAEGNIMINDFLEELNNYNYFIDNEVVNSENDENAVLYKLNNQTTDILYVLSKLLEKREIILNQFNNVIIEIYKCNIKPPTIIFHIIYYMGKNFPWWINVDIDNYKKKILYRYCIKFNGLINEIKNKTTNDAAFAENISKKKNYSNFKYRITDAIKIENQFGLTDATMCLPTVELVSENASVSERIQSIRTLKITENITMNTIIPTLTEEVNNDENDDSDDADSIEKKKAQAKLSELLNAKIIDASDKFYKSIINYCSKTSSKCSQEGIPNFKSTVINEATTYANELAREGVPTEYGNEDNYLETMKRTISNIVPSVQPTGEGETDRVGGGFDNEDNFNSSSSLIFNKSSNKDTLKQPSVDQNESITQNKADIIDEATLKKFYIESYKCNNGNYLINFINKIKEIDVTYSDLTINFETDSVKDILNKILLTKIMQINKSYIPAITNNDIIKSLENINNDYTIEQLSSIINRYDSQFNYFTIIYSITNYGVGDDDQDLLFNLIIENTTEYDYKELNLGFMRQNLIEKLTGTNKIITSPQLHSEDITEPTESESNIDEPALKQPIDFGKYLPLQTNNYSQLKSDSNKTMSIAAGSIKNKPKQKINKTRNSKRKNKKYTIKKRKTNVRRYTRRR